MSSDPSQTIEQTAEEQRELQKQVDRLERIPLRLNRQGIPKAAYL
jgi:hypothetical protein